MTRAISTRRLIATVLGAALVLGLWASVEEILSRAESTPAPSDVLLGILVIVSASWIVPRLGYLRTVGVSLGAAALLTAVAIGGGLIVWSLGGPRPWMPTLPWLGWRLLMLAALTLLARYMALVTRAQQLRARRLRDPAV